jgi:two-component system, sensor histidine kinase and response regulator
MGIVKRLCEMNAQLGMDENLSDYKKKRLIIFNSINVFSFLLAVSWFLHVVILPANNITSTDVVINLIPVVASFVACLLIKKRKYQLAIYANTVVIPIGIFISNLHLQEGSGLLYLTIYAIFPFFFHTKFYKIFFHYLFVVSLYGVSSYYMNLHVESLNKIVFSSWLQVAVFVFFFAVLYLVKVQVLSYESLLKKNKELLKVNNEELKKLLTLKDQIFTVIAHDIIIPLNSMQMISSQIIEEGYDREILEEVFPVMNDEIIKTKNLFSNLLDWSKAQLEGRGQDTTNVMIADVAAIVLNQVEEQARLKNIKIINEVNAEMVADINKDNLMVATRNLIINAIKFTATGGTIKLVSKEINEYVQLNIVDTGKGITNEVIKKIFGEDIYTSTGTNEETGNGFGLKISRELIKQNGGSVFCETSTLGVGSTFSIKMKKAKKVDGLELVA